jgi:hypothetical protein
MILELPEELETAIKAQATARGVSPSGYVLEVLVRALAPLSQASIAPGALRTGRGLLAKYGSAPSSEEIDANRAEMFRNFGEGFV